MKLSVKFTLLSLITATAVSAMCATGFYSALHSRDQLELANKITVVTQRHMEGDMMHDGMKGDVLLGIVSHEQEQLKAFQEARNDLKAHYENFKHNITANQKEELPANIKAVFDNALIALENYYQGGDAVYKKLDLNQDYLPAMTAFNKTFETMEAEMEEISNKLDQWSKTEAQVVNKQTAFLSMLTNILGAMTIILTFSVPLFSRFSVFAPLNQLSDTMRKLVKGDFNLEVKGVKRKDEVGIMASSVKVFQENGIARLKLEAEQERQKEAALQAEQEREKRERFLAEEQKRALKQQEDNIAAQVQGIINACASGDFTQRIEEAGKQGLLLTLSQGMNRICSVTLNGLDDLKDALNALKNGDLTYKVSDTHQGLFAEIAEAYHGMSNNLTQTITNINQASDTVSTAAEEVSAGSADLSRRTEEQAATLEQTAAAMEQLTSAVRENAKNAQSAKAFSDGSLKTASGGGEVVMKAIDSMRKIQEASGKISDIILVIDTIASQTNLLALNAAVEAARAGEAGKGFAVVASEVRSLAVRSANASHEIKNLIKSTLKQVTVGGKLVEESGGALEKIIESVGKTSEYVNMISEAGTEQLTTLEEINRAVGNIDDMTQQNATLVDENSAAAKSMSDQGRNLTELVRFFKYQKNHAVGKRRNIA